MSVGSLLGNLSYSCVVRVALDMGSEVLKTAFNVQAFTTAPHTARSWTK